MVRSEYLYSCAEYLKVDQEYFNVNHDKSGRIPIYYLDWPHIDFHDIANILTKAFLIIKLERQREL